MGKFSDICKIMEDLDHKYHMDNNEKEDDALIKHLEEEYQKEHQQNEPSK